MTATYGTCAMQMPSYYVALDADEMIYVDGGFNRTGIEKGLAGVTVYFNSRQTNTLTYVSGVGAVTAQVLNMIPVAGPALAAAVGITVAFATATLAWMNSDGSGVKVFIPWVAINPVCPVKGVLMDQKWNVW